MQNPINTSSITQFAQLVKAAELSQQKEVKIPINHARLINLALVEILDKLNRDYESMYNKLTEKPTEETISISLDGGGFRESE